ncbi:MAG: serine hydrolase domain-containing protein [Pseudohongiella sp.]|uniref:serine hydrolase domain-containing protein n=1 Tax=Pseudohongiella sp. TaxID=1979412 RepID=UPI0034A01F2D
MSVICSLISTLALADDPAPSTYSTSSASLLQQGTQPTFYQVPGQLPTPITQGDIADFSTYKRWLQQEVTEQGIPGVALAIVSSSDILDLQTYGLRSVQQDLAVDSDTVFRIASVSKTFAGTVASQLVSSNISTWDEPISTILPYDIGTDAATRQMTLRHVLSHTTGLMPHAFSNMLDAGVAYQKIQEKFHEIPTVCPPGSCYGYQNVVFSLVADVVEVSLRTTYDDFVVENIFLPLGMNQASMGYEAFRDNPNASSPHQFARGGWRLSSVNEAYYTTGPAAGVNATILDMARWAQANLGGAPDVLPRALLDIQHTPVVETPRGNYFNRWPKVKNAWYGLGWRILDYDGMRVIHHGGGVRGYRSEIVLVPAYDIALVVMFNAETRLANDVVPHFLDNLQANINAL